MDNIDKVVPEMRVLDIKSVDEFFEVIPHFRHMSRSFLIFPVRFGSSLEYWGIEKSYFEDETGELRLYSRLKLPRYRCMVGASLEECENLCRASVEAEYLVQTGVRSMEAARLAIRHMKEENKNG